MSTLSCFLSYTDIWAWELTFRVDNICFQLKQCPYLGTIFLFMVRRLHDLAPSQTPSLREFFFIRLFLLKHKLEHTLPTPSLIKKFQIYLAFNQHPTQLMRLGSKWNPKSERNYLSSLLLLNFKLVHTPSQRKYIYFFLTYIIS